MTRSTHGAKVVLLDSSPFFRFCDGGAVIYLNAYLRKRAHITLEVAEELKLNSTTYVDLQTLDRMHWPPPENVHELPSELKQELLDILRGLHEPGDHPMKHAGEVSTVLMAQHMGRELIVLEDRDGKALARQRDVPRVSSAMLAAEMVAMGAMEERVGYAVFDAATPDGIGENEWRTRLAQAKAAIPPPPKGKSATSSSSSRPRGRPSPSTNATSTGPTPHRKRGGHP